MSLITDEIRAKATEIYRGNDVCIPQTRRLFKEVGFPNGLLPLRDVEEVGYVEDSFRNGFVWLKQKKEIEHKFEKIGKLVRYAPEITAYIEEGKIKKLTGVKAKEIIIWVVINEITIGNPDKDKIIFKNNATGVKKVFPCDAFVIDVDEPVIDHEALNLVVKAKEIKEVGANGVEKEANEKKDVDVAAPVAVAPKAIEVKDV